MDLSLYYSINTALLRLFTVMLYFVIKVRLLLKELEEARGTVVRMDLIEPDMLTSNGSGASGIISQKLVNFRFYIS